MEFRMTTDLSTTLAPQEIGFNYEELKQQLAERVEKYKGLIVTEEGIADAKKDRALLRKVATALNDEKIRVKNQWMVPYTAFESQVKELIALCDGPSKAIDEQIKRFEEAQKAEKKGRLATYFQENVGSAAEYVTFDVIFDPKWLNATVDENAAKKQIDDMLSRYWHDVETLELIDAEPGMKVMLKAEYKRTKSLARVMQFKQELDLASKREAEMEARRKAAQEQAEREAQTVQMPESQLQQPQENQSPDEGLVSHANDFSQSKVPTYKIGFWAENTAEKFPGLREYLQSNEFRYGKIDI